MSIRNYCLYYYYKPIAIRFIYKNMLISCTTSPIEKIEKLHLHLIPISKFIKDKIICYRTLRFESKARSNYT